MVRINGLRQTSLLEQTIDSGVTENGVGWFEGNAFLGVDEEGTPIANILGRDIHYEIRPQLQGLLVIGRRKAVVGIDSHGTNRLWPHSGGSAAKRAPIKG